MEYVVVCCVTFLASGLTLFSGFGLGTLLLPAFLVFFDPKLAVAMTALVHFANNLFKLGLFGKFADSTIVTRFGIPSVISAFIGAYVLLLVSQREPLVSYTVFNLEAVITPVKILMATLILSFAILEMLPSGKILRIDNRWLPLGGFLSGFFGGLSGHQGALRSVFLVRAIQSKQVYIGTGVMIACLVDATRITVYGRHLFSTEIEESTLLIVCTTLSAFLGVFIASKVSGKVTMKSIKYVVAAFLFLVAMGLGSGLF